MNRSAILVIRPEKIGDLVAATPSIRALKTSFPDAPLHLLTDDISGELLRHDPNVDRLISIPWRGSKPHERPSWLQIRSLLTSERYRRAAVLYPNNSGWNWLCASLQIPQVAQLGGTWASLLLGHHRVMRKSYRTPRHYSRYYLEVAMRLGAKPLEDTLPRLYLNPSEMDALRTRFPAYFARRPRIVIHPFGLTTQFNLSIESYIALAMKLSIRYGVTVSLIGTAAEAARLTDIKASHVDLSFLGTLSIREMMGVLSQADVVVGGPSGIVHVAAATGAATIGLYCSAYHHDIVWGPQGPRAETLAVTAAECPCLQNGVEVCSGRRFCDLTFALPLERIASRAGARLTEAGIPG